MRKIIMTLIILLVLAIPAQACWVYLSVEEMDAQAELIVIGRYTGEYREVITNQGYGLTYWTVEVDYVIKGEALKTIEVVTGGASGANVEVSTDYTLTSHADGDMLLYLNKENDGYGPNTPRGIVNLGLSDGGSLLGKYDISSQYMEDQDRVDIPKFIDLRADDIVDMTQVEDDYESQEEVNEESIEEATEEPIDEPASQQSYGWLALLVLPVGAGTYVGLISRRKRKQP